MTFPELFTPGRIGNLEIPNRIIKSPQTTATANQDGTITQRTVNHYRRLGEGGTGLVLMEYSYIDDDASKSIHAQVGISRREHVPGLGWLVDEVHSTGAKVGIQLVHTGRQKFLGQGPMKSASDSSWDYVESQYGNKPVPMTLTEIEGVVEAFGKSAARAYNARFDIVEVHAGHGYLITNFLSPHTNFRTDEYGGSFENRSRLLIEVVDSIRRHVPRDFPLSIRVSVTDYEADGIPIDETVTLCRLLEDHGVDVIHASGGHHAQMEWEVSPWFMDRTPHRWGWELIREAVGIPIIGSGSVVSPEIAHDIIASGSADFVSLGRALLADPDWAKKAKSGRMLEITPCIRCNDGCLHRGINTGRSLGCSVNPNVAEEGRFPVQISERPKKVAVVGGGPAGLRSAATLHDRGHQVDIYESGQLGGLLVHASGSKVKQDLAALSRHLIHEAQRRGITVINEHANVETLLGAGYETVFLAVGAPEKTAEFDVDPVMKVLLPSEANEATVPAGDIVIIGGGLQGSETALRLAAIEGKHITLVEKCAQLVGGPNEVFTDVTGLPGRLALAEVESLTATEALAVTADGVTIRDCDGIERTLPADCVVLALGSQQFNDTFSEPLREAGVEVQIVGSAQRPGRVLDAIHSAYFLSRRS